MKMIYCKEIDDYIKSKEPKSTDILLLVKNIVKPLLKSNAYFDSDTFYKCLEYTEKYYYEMFPFQKFIYALFFFYEDETKLFTTFDTFFIMEGRGNGKDGFMAPLADFLTTHYHGIKNYNVDVVANSEEQAKGLTEIIYNRMEDYKDKMKKFFRWTIEVIINRKTHSKITYNTSNSKTKDGKRPGMIIFNEFHQYENYLNINVHMRGKGKVQNPRVVIITTDGSIREGPLDDYKALSEKRLKGLLPNSKLCPILYRLDNEKEIDKPEMWVKANPSLPYMPVLKREIETDYALMQDMPHMRPDFITKRMNLPKEDAESVFCKWETILKTKRPLPNPNKALAIFGMDYAELNDFASGGFLWKNGNDYCWMQHTWINKNSPFFKSIKPPLQKWEDEGFVTIVDTPTIDPNLILDWFFENAVFFNVQILSMDKFRWEAISDDFEARELSVVTKENPNGEIVHVRSGGWTQNEIAPVMDVIYANGHMIYGDDPCMRWFTQNTGVKRDGKGNKTYFKIEPKLRKNDGFMALVHAMSERSRLDIPEWNPDGNPYL
ncbi:terminase large subunit [Alkalibaculum sp. M08DMB]|uniref:Terminase large subunit n=1 Tax=Alkalibaculum sporogenes TaxID=2655001 RepID=A0A6A7KA39_9FIRM|nr:terminase TerL endonuclease subunit [Alkalibaculum sporogenes]MPW26409.1 terminase large subunit [Alkalibaculum sporogenes]